MKNIADLIFRFRKTIVVVVISITLLSGFFITKVKINPDVFNNLPKDDEAAALFNKVGEKYGGNYMCIIGIENDNVFTTKTLEHIQQITDSLKVMKGIGSVTSLTSIIDIRGSEWGIEISNLIDPYNIPTDQTVLDTLRNYILSKKLYNGSLVSGDGKLTIVVARLMEGTDKIEVARELRSKVASLHIPEKIYFGGQPFVILEWGKNISRDLLVIAPLCLLLIILILFFAFRSFRGVLFPILNIGISMIWTFSVMGILGINISIITSIIPVLLVAIGSAYTIHVMNRIYVTSSGDYNERLKMALSYIIKPVIFASVTDIFGFISFAFGSYLDIITKFGIFTSLGIFFALILAITFTPALMFVFPEKKLHRQKESDFSLLNNLVNGIKNTVIKHPKRVIAGWLIVSLIFLGGIPMIKRNVDFLEYFRKNNENRITEKKLQDKIGGTSPVYILVKGDIEDPKNLNKIASIQEAMSSNRLMVNNMSICDLIKEMNYIIVAKEEIPESRKNNENRITEKKLQDKIGGTSPVYILVKGDIEDPKNLNKIASIQDAMSSNRLMVNNLSICDLIKEMNYIIVAKEEIPESRKKVQNLMFLLDGQEILSRLVKPDFKEALIQGTFSSNNLDEMKKFVSDMKKQIRKTGTSELNFTISGLPSLYIQLDNSVLKSQVQSLLISILLIFISVTFLSRSFLRGTIAIIPIICTLALLFGIMGYFSIPLDLATVLVGSICVGIGIDYSIHVVSNYNYETKRGVSVQEAIEKTILMTGKSVLINMLSVSLGFIVLMMSSLVPLQRFGVLVALTMIISGLGAITLLPSVLLTIFGSKNKFNSHEN